MFNKNVYLVFVISEIPDQALGGFFFNLKGVPILYGSGTYNFVVNISGRTIRWWSTTNLGVGHLQFNGSGRTYYYAGLCY